MSFYFVWGVIVTTYGLTGYDGYVGQELMQYKGVVPLACDVRNLSEVEMAVKNVKPDLIVHLASISDVDQCEKPENEKDVKDVNVVGTFHVAEVARKIGCDMVLLSTAHVFDGKWGNYKEKSKPNPKNFYGLTKMAAEGFREIFPFMKIVRTSYLFNHERVFKHLYPLRAGESFEYPTFIDRSFMYLPHFVEALYWYLLNYQHMPNVLHISGMNAASWYTFICSMAQVYGLNTSLVIPRNKEIKVDSAPRPYKAGLNVKMSQKIGMPQYGYLEGLQEMRERNK
jgi:dTDP-4-dehydrorhamnose reductase